MAEVTQCFGRRADTFTLKTLKRRCVKSRVHYSRSPVRAACLSAGFLLEDTVHVGLYGPENAAGTARDGYTRAGRPSGASTERHTGEDHCYSASVSWTASGQSRVLTVRSPLPHHQGHVTVWRTPAGSLRGHRSPRDLHGGQPACSRAYSGFGDDPEPPYKTKTGYYDILEVLPSATHAQIKTAYYKQSFTFHPDRNAGSDDATVRFSQISEAYTVLGDKGLRRKYDLGLLTLADLTATRRPSGRDAAGAPGRQQGRRAALSAEQRGGVFDFDVFYKSHYGEQLQRQRDLRVRKEQLQKQKEEGMADRKMDRMMEIGVGALLLLAVGLVLSLRKH